MAMSPPGCLHLSEMIHESRICWARGPPKPSGKGKVPLRENACNATSLTKEQSCKVGSYKATELPLVLMDVL